MTQGNNKAIAILGAGFSGLRPGLQLVDKEFSVGICEKDPYVGGLFRYDHTTNPVMESADYVAKFTQTGKTKKEFLREPIAKALFF
jgi:protoporphyrinogen oxidase